LRTTNQKKGETQWEREHNKLVKAKLSKQKKANPLTTTTFWILAPTHPSHVKQVHNTNQWDWNFDHNLPIKHITICKNARKAKDSSIVHTTKYKKTGTWTCIPPLQITQIHIQCFSSDLGSMINYLPINICTKLPH